MERSGLRDPATELPRSPKNAKQIANLDSQAT